MANEAIARTNLSLQDRLYLLRTETKEAFDEAKSLEFRWKDVEREQWEVYQNRGDDSIPAGISGAFPSLALSSDSSLAHAISARRELGLRVSTQGASDAVQLSLSVLQAISGPIPLAGGPMQAAINGLLATLQVINRHTQNKAAIASLKMRLYRLFQHLCNAPTARDHLEQLRRDALISVLEATSEQLTRLSKRFLVYQSVTQAITGCSSDLDQYLQEHSLSAQTHIQNVVVETRDILVQQFRGPTAMQPGTFTPGCFILVDATGRERPIPVDFGTSYEQLKKLLDTWFIVRDLVFQAALDDADSATAMSHSQLVRDLVFQATDTTLTEPRPCPVLSLATTISWARSQRAVRDLVFRAA
ncbi:hypothetical protein AZE42_03435 [Rhizopogon vesiculosus]|uniref:VPS37 C-terminal domain-containing protein n=1 Tax=Rhizopogon vesiculosus TaxID=180088 RepID=A0A1J8PWJ5_9AGAM|nr:hypothetical protein AZE42_03435 [Rhizopogon vesiculosus]